MADGHDFDDDCVCRRCGLDAAEWVHYAKLWGHDNNPLPQCDGADDERR